MPSHLRLLVMSPRLPAPPAPHWPHPPTSLEQFLVVCRMSGYPPHLWESDVAAPRPARTRGHDRHSITQWRGYARSVVWRSGDLRPWVLRLTVIHSHPVSTGNNQPLLLFVYNAEWHCLTLHWHRCLTLPSPCPLVVKKIPPSLISLSMFRYPLDGLAFALVGFGLVWSQNKLTWGSLWDSSAARTDRTFFSLLWSSLWTGFPFTAAPPKLEQAKTDSRRQTPAGTGLASLEKQSGR